MIPCDHHAPTPAPNCPTCQSLSAEYTELRLNNNDELDQLEKNKMTSRDRAGRLLRIVLDNTPRAVLAAAHQSHTTPKCVPETPMFTGILRLPVVIKSSAQVPSW